MEQPYVTAIQAIQAILAPALGISAVALLMLGLTNRYSNIVSRIRLLNDEKRKMNRILGEKGELSFTDNSRYISVNKQTEELLYRSKIMRNAILSLQTAIGLFVLSSATIALNIFLNAAAIRILPLLIFILGMFSVFAGVLYSAKEIYRSYTIILMEVHGEE